MLSSTIRSEYLLHLGPLIKIISFWAFRRCFLAQFHTNIRVITPSTILDQFLEKSDPSLFGL